MIGSICVILGGAVFSTRPEMIEELIIAEKSNKLSKVETFANDNATRLSNLPGDLQITVYPFTPEISGYVMVFPDENMAKAYYVKSEDVTKCNHSE